jgi:hypothetical protein
MPEQFWVKDPAVLFTSENWSKFVPLQGMTTAESLNSVVRFSVYFALMLFLANGSTAYMLTVPIVMVFTVVLYNLFPNGKTLEPFTESMTQKKSYTMPSQNNPFMNVLLTDIGDNPNREDAAPTNRRDVKAEIYKNFQKTSDIYMDTSDLFDQTQAMRTFLTMQSARVPEDLDGFKKWLAKGLDEPDYSSAPLSRGAKLLSEGHVVAKGAMRDLPNTTAVPTGTAPSAAPSTKSSSK